MGKSAARSQPPAKKSAEKTPPVAPNNRSIAAKKRYAREREQREEKERLEREANKNKLQQHLLAGSNNTSSEKDAVGSDSAPSGTPTGSPPAPTATAASPKFAMPTPVAINLAAAATTGVESPPAATTLAPPLLAATGSQPG